MRKNGLLEKTLTGILMLGALISGGCSSTHDNKEVRQKEDPVRTENINPKRELSSYGTVVYEKNPEAEKQIYIILQTHRIINNGITYESEFFPEIQRNICRIGERLIREEGAEVIFPEGVIEGEDHYESFKRIREERRDLRARIRNAGDEELKEMINEGTFGGMAGGYIAVGNDSYIVGPEDERLFRDATRLMSEEKGEEPSKKFLELSENRTERIMNNIKRKMSEERGKGRIIRERGMFVYGSEHKKEIIEYAERTSKDYGIKILAPRLIEKVRDGRIVPSKVNE